MTTAPGLLWCKISINSDYFDLLLKAAPQWLVSYNVNNFKFHLFLFCLFFETTCQVDGEKLNSHALEISPSH